MKVTLTFFCISLSLEGLRNEDFLLWVCIKVNWDRFREMNKGDDWSSRSAVWDAEKVLNYFAHWDYRLRSEILNFANLCNISIRLKVIKINFPLALRSVATLFRYFYLRGMDSKATRNQERKYFIFSRDASKTACKSLHIVSTFYSILISF